MSRLVAALPNPIQLSPIVYNFVKNLPNGPPLSDLPIPEGRKFLSNLQARYPIKTPQVIVKDFNLRNESTNIPVRMVRPRSEVLPVIFYIHGGGWVLGDVNIYDRLIKTLCIGAEAAIVFIEYQKSPEVRFPHALEEIYSSLAYISAHNQEFQIDPTRMAIMGDSVGENMATVIARMAKERRNFRIIQQILFYPVTDCQFDTPSYWQFALGPWLTQNNMYWFWTNYEPNPNNWPDKNLSPLRAEIQDLVGMPPTLIITAENDVLRDEGEAYAHKLMRAGVYTQSFRCLGVIHDFLMLNGLASDPGVIFSLDMAMMCLRKAFQTVG